MNFLISGEQNDAVGAGRRRQRRQEVPDQLHRPTTLRNQLHLHGTDHRVPQRVGANHQPSAAKATRLRGRDKESDRLHQEDELVKR